MESREAPFALWPLTPRVSSSFCILVQVMVGQYFTASQKRCSAGIHRTCPFDVLGESDFLCSLLPVTAITHLTHPYFRTL
jgi:hypothetical protein